MGRWQHGVREMSGGCIPRQGLRKFTVGLLESTTVFQQGIVCVLNQSHISEQIFESFCSKAG